MILLDQIIQILGRADRDRPRRRMLGEFSNGPVRGGVAVQRDGLRPSHMCSHGFTQICLRRADRAVAAEMRNRTLSALVDAAIEIRPCAADLHVRLVDAP